MGTDCDSKVVLAGLHMPGSGLTSVLTHLAVYLSSRMKVSLLVFDPFDGSARDGEICGIQTRFAPLQAGYMRAENAWLAAVLQSSTAPTFLITGPANMARSLLKQLSTLRPQIRVIYYLPTEGEIIDKEILDIVDCADDCVLYTKSPFDDITKIYAAQSRISSTNLHVIGHGVDKSFFDSGLRQKIQARHKVRQALWRTDNAHEFVVLNVNRPYLRKRLDLSIKGFSLFARNYPHSRLVLHPGLISAKQREELEENINSAGSSAKISVISSNALLCQEQLNILYNACDVGLTTAMGEGWGLTTFEHAITGAPQIVPDHTSFSANWRGFACMLPTLTTYPVFYEYSRMHVTTPEFVAEALSRVRSDADYRRVLGSAAKDRAQKNASWGYVGRRFLELITSQSKNGDARNGCEE